MLFYCKQQALSISSGCVVPMKPDVGELALKAAERQIQDNLRHLQAQLRSLKDRMRALRRAGLLTPKRKYKLTAEILSTTAYLRPGVLN